MKNVMLISAEAVRKSGYTHKNVLPETIDTTIRRAQHIMLRKLMVSCKGRKFYDDFIDLVSAALPPTPTIVPLSPDNEDLLKNYIQPYLVCCVDYLIILPLTLRHRSKSVGKGLDENHEPAGFSEMVRLKDQMLIFVDSYAESLRDKLLEETDQCCDKSSGAQFAPGRALKFR